MYIDLLYTQGLVFKTYITLKKKKFFKAYM